MILCGAHRDGGKSTRLQGSVMYSEKIADWMQAIAKQIGRIFPRGIKHVVIEYEDPVFEPGHDRLHQDRVVVAGDLADIVGERGLAGDALREVAARPPSAA